MATEVLQPQQFEKQAHQPQQLGMQGEAKMPTLAERLRGVAGEKFHDILMNEFAPFIDRKITEAAERGLFQISLSLDDFKDHPRYEELSHHWYDDTCHELILNHLRQSDLECHFYPDENEQPTLFVSWREISEEDREADRWSQQQQQEMQQQMQQQMPQQMQQQPMQQIQQQPAQQQQYGFQFPYHVLPSTVVRKEEAEQIPGAKGLAALQPLGAALPTTGYLGPFFGRGVGRGRAWGFGRGFGRFGGFGRGFGGFGGPGFGFGGFSGQGFGMFGGPGFGVPGFGGGFGFGRGFGRTPFAGGFGGGTPGFGAMGMGQGPTTSVQQMQQQQTPSQAM
jgi:hypothetical protein